MNENDARLFTVGELARRCGVTVRTLQFYDSEGLLSPRHYTEGGRRLYGRDDIIRLQQILFLKSFGFPLEEIRDRVLDIASPREFGDMLARQREVIEGQINKMREMADFLGRVTEEIRHNDTLSTEKLVAIIEMMKTGSPFAFFFRYFNQKEMQTLVTLFDEKDKRKSIAPQWQELFSQVVVLYKSGASPEGEEGQALAQKWWALVQEFTKGDPAMMNTLIRMGEDVDNWPQEAGEFKEAVKVFLGKAIEAYLKKSQAQGVGDAAERG